MKKPTLSNPLFWYAWGSTPEKSLKIQTGEPVMSSAKCLISRGICRKWPEREKSSSLKIRTNCWLKKGISRHAESPKKTISRSTDSREKSNGRAYFRFFCLSSEARRSTIFILSAPRSEEHTSELQSQFHLVCRLLL